MKPMKKVEVNRVKRQGGNLYKDQKIEVIKARVEEAQAPKVPQKGERDETDDGGHAIRI
jgi:hypothetical protein